MKTYKAHLINQFKNVGLYIGEALIIFGAIRSGDNYIIFALGCIALPFVFAALKLVYQFQDEIEIASEYRRSHKINDPNDLMDRFMNPNNNFEVGEVVYAPIGCSGNKVYKNYNECKSIILKEVEKRQQADNEHISKIDIYVTNPEFIPYKKWQETSEDWWTNGQEEIYIIKFEII